MFAWRSPTSTAAPWLWLNWNPLFVWCYVHWKQKPAETPNPFSLSKLSHWEKLLDGQALLPVFVLLSWCTAEHSGSYKLITSLPLLTQRVKGLAADPSAGVVHREHTLLYKYRDELASMRTCRYLSAHLTQTPIWYTSKWIDCITLR